MEWLKILGTRCIVLLRDDLTVGPRQNPPPAPVARPAATDAEIQGLGAARQLYQGLQDTATAEDVHRFRDQLSLGGAALPQEATRTLARLDQTLGSMEECRRQNQPISGSLQQLLREDAMALGQMLAEDLNHPADETPRHRYGEFDRMDPRFEQQSMPYRDPLARQRWHEYTEMLQQAGNPNTPPDQLAALATSFESLDPSNRGSRVSAALARNPSTPADLLEQMADSDNPDLRRGVASNRSTPPDALGSLSADRGLALSLIDNPNAPPVALARISENPDRAVRDQLSRREDLPEVAVDRLSRDPDRGVRMSIADNPQVSGPELERLYNDRDPRVRAYAASNPNIPPDVLTSLERDPRSNDEIRVHVAGNPVAPQETLERLAANQDPVVRRTVAHNPSTPRPLLERLSQDNDEGVRLEAQRRLQAMPPPT